MTEDEVMGMCPPPEGPAAKLTSSHECERIVVTTADGRVFDLGKPKGFGFRWRVWRYRRARFKRGI